jgi:type II secretory pathway component GspD/PulD (secretin)
MKKIFITTLAIFFLIFAFFVSRLNAQEQPALVGAQPSISMDFKDAGLKDILKAFSMQSGMNFIASEAVQDRKVTLYLDKVPLIQAMDKIFSANNLSYELDREANIFVVKEWGKMETETVTKVFYLKNATVSTSSLKDELSKNLANTSVNTSKSGSSGSGANSSSSGSGSNSGTSTRSKFKEEDEGGITSVVKKLLSNTESFQGSLIEDFRTNSLIVTDTPMKMKIISQVIASLDVAVPQVMLEVEMLDVRKDAVDKMGFQFGDTPFTAIVTGATAALGFPYGAWGKIIDPGTGVLSINPSGSTYDMQLDFMRKQTDTKFLARPKLLTLNNETAEISITKDEAVQATPQYSTNTSGATYITGYDIKRATELALTNKGIGISLRVTPQIDLESNEITMVINPESSSASLSSFSTDTIPILDPEVRSSKSIVKVKDGETIILGGLIHQEKNVEMKKLPILGDIPLLSMFFRHKNQDVGLERELIIFITPRIVRDKLEPKIANVQNFQLPIREQGSVVGTSRDYIINSNMNKFENNINGKR